MAAELRPWDRRDTESAIAFKAFACYRNMGDDRSLEKTGKVLGKHPDQLAKWSSRHEWVKRAAAFDTEAAARAAVVVLDDATEARIRQARLGRQLQDAAAEAIAKSPDDQRTAGWAVQAAKTGAELERAALGMTDKRVTIEGTVDHVVKVTWPDDVRRALDDDPDDADDA